MPFTLGTLGRIDHIYVVLQADRSIGTLELTRTADGALGCDYLVSHHCDSIKKVRDSFLLSSLVPDSLSLIRLEYFR